jgi:hypothetical protein
MQRKRRDQDISGLKNIGVHNSAMPQAFFLDILIYFLGKYVSVL